MQKIVIFIIAIHRRDSEHKPIALSIGDVDKFSEQGESLALSRVEISLDLNQFLSRMLFYEIEMTT